MIEFHKHFYGWRLRVGPFFLEYADWPRWREIAIFTPGRDDVWGIRLGRFDIWTLWGAR